MRSEAYWLVGRGTSEGNEGGVVRSGRENRRGVWIKPRQGGVSSKGYLVV